MNLVDFSANRSLYFFLQLQAAMVLGFSLLVLLFKGSVPALSGLAGGSVAFAGGMLYILVLRRPHGGSPAGILHLHVAAEIVKVIGMFCAAVVLYFWCRQVDWFWVAAGWLVAYSAYWFGLLIKH
jgi:F0F1-type ATP synthase assembly protein I